MSLKVILEENNLATDSIKLATRYGINLVEEPSFNEMGLDFRIAFAKDINNTKWVLRIPRREDLFLKIEKEAKILNFVKSRIAVQVPEWKVCTKELVAYPMLLDSIALTFDSQTYDVTWHIDKHSDIYIESLANTLVSLHASSVDEATANGISYSTSSTIKTQLLADIERVKKEIGLGSELEAQLRTWINNEAIWPSFSVLVHGDLYAGHVTADSSSRITGIIDWSEAEITDPSIDFVGHLAVFGEESLEKLVSSYVLSGGRDWPGMIEQIKARHVASPLRYAIFALNTGSEEHLAAAKTQLGVTPC